MNIRVQDEYKVKDADVNKPGFTKGEIEFIVKDKLGKVIRRWNEPDSLATFNPPKPIK